MTVETAHRQARLQVPPARRDRRHPAGQPRLPRPRLRLRRPRGYSRISLMRRQPRVGGIAVEEYGLRTFANGAQPGTSSSTRTAHQGSQEEHRDELGRGAPGPDERPADGRPRRGHGDRARWASRRRTRSSSSRAVLDEEIARGLRLSPHKLSDLTNGRPSRTSRSRTSTTSSARSARRRSDRAADQQGHHRRPDVLRRAPVRRPDAGQDARAALSPNEARDMDNMNPIPDGSGDVYLAPLNMSPLDQLGAAASARALSAPPPTP
jgi:hypothetical protein